MEAIKHVRFYRCSYIVGWEPLNTGLLLIYSDGQREVVEMPAKEADENCQFLCDELAEDRDFIGIAWEDEDKLGLVVEKVEKRKSYRVCIEVSADLMAAFKQNTNRVSLLAQELARELNRVLEQIEV